MSLCPEAHSRSLMSDAEFWAHVHGADVPDFSWLEDLPDVWALECARCGRTVAIDEFTRTERERDHLCDDCADELLPEDEWSE